MTQWILFIIGFNVVLWLLNYASEHQEEAEKPIEPVKEEVVEDGPIINFISSVVIFSLLAILPVIFLGGPIFLVGLMFGMSLKLWLCIMAVILTGLYIGLFTEEGGL